MGNLKRNCLRTVLLAILVAAVFAPSVVHANDYTVGVKAGDWVKYGQITFNWTGNGTEPSFAAEAKKLDWARIDVLSVAGTTASLNLTLHFNNGTQTFQGYDVDVQGRGVAGIQYVVASNLAAGDPLSPQTPETTINQTVTRLYAGMYRNVNILDIRGNFSAGLLSYPTEAELYWDQNTGILVEAYSNQTDRAYPDAYYEESIIATETNMFSANTSANALDFIQNNIAYIIAGVAALIIIVAATIFLRRRKAPSVQQTPPPSAPPPSPS